MLTIIFEAHGTTFDNERGVASGHGDVELSPLGELQAKELGERYAGRLPSAVFCSNLQRSWRTAEIAFAHTQIPIVRDSRLNECDYGQYAGKPTAQVDAEKGSRVTVPFPGGQSYEETTRLVSEFVDELKSDYNGKTVLIIGNRATQYALEHLTRRIPLREAVVAPWAWQPGWVYHL